MSTGLNTELLLGCDPQVRVVIIEDEGNLVLQVFAEDPAAVDIDALFFSFADGFDATGLTIYPGFDEAIGSNGENVTGFDFSTGALNQMNNGAQIQDTHDVRLEFGTVPYTTMGDVDQAALTFYIDGGASNLTAESLDLTSMTAVINTDNGGGMALTGGLGNGGDDPTTVYETNTVLADDFDGLSYANQSDIVSWGGHWQVRNGELAANGCNDGYIYFDQVAVEGETTLSFDARVPHAENFEDGGYYGDSFEVWALVDGSDWQLLDVFTVNDDGTALVGNTTGQTIGADSQTLTYSGGELADADTVQLVLGAHFTASDEQIYVDNVEITDTVLVDEETSDEVIAEEGFDSGYHASDADLVANYYTRWDIRDGELQTDGCDDGQIWFEEVQTNGETQISIDARAPHTEYFESGGCYGDSLDVWALVDGTTWQHLDTFTVNGEGTALVGNETGQAITAESSTLSWDGGLLADADSVQLYMYSDISSSNEEVFFDNLTISNVTDDTEDDGTDPNCGQYDIVYDELMNAQLTEEEVDAMFGQTDEADNDEALMGV